MLICGIILMGLQRLPASASLGCCILERDERASIQPYERNLDRTVENDGKKKAIYKPWGFRFACIRYEATININIRIWWWWCTQANPLWGLGYIALCPAVVQQTLH